MRFRHMQRSCLVSRDGAAIWSECYKGKVRTRRGREAFRRCAPRVSLERSEVDILDEYWSMWSHFKAANPALFAMILDAHNEEQPMVACAAARRENTARLRHPS